MGYVINRELLRSVMGRKERGRSDFARRVVTEEVLAGTRVFNERCTCDEHGLEPGLPITELITLAEGCTGKDRPMGWVCARLDAVRRRYGL